MSMKEKSIIGLHEKIELARVTEDRLNAKVENLESMTLKNDVGLNVIDATSMDRTAEKISKIRELEEENKQKAEMIEKHSEKINEVRLELTRMKDMLAEKDMYIKNVDNLYEEIINRKDKTIECFNRVTEADDEMAKGFKRLLMKTMADKEMQNVKELYREMKSRNVSVQTARYNAEEKRKGVDASTQVLNHNEESDREISPELCEVLDGTRRVEVSLSGEVHVGKHCSRNKNNDLVTLRVMNLPADMDIQAVEKFFDIKVCKAEKLCHVQIDRINNQRTIVKIVASESIVPDILKFDQMVVYKRKIKVFRVEKCRLGGECARKICRFGHEERFRISDERTKLLDNIQVSSGKDNTEDKNTAPSNNLQMTKPSLWKIRNLPEKMNKLGVIRFITNLGVVVEERRSLYQVLSIKSHDCSRGMKVEAVLSMTEEMGERLMSHNGMEVGDTPVEISRIKECRLGHKCHNKGKCAFYHERKVDSGRDRPDDAVESKRGQSDTLCWFQSSCPFGKNCRFYHPSTSEGPVSSGSVASPGIMSVKN